MLFKIISMYVVLLFTFCQLGCSESLNGPSGSSPTAAAVADRLALDPSEVSVFTVDQATLTATGGTPPYTFAVDPACLGTVSATGPNGSSGLFQAGSSTGNCTVTVTDETGATSSAPVSILQAAQTLTYTWVVGGFGACSVACGGGTQSQTVTCEDSNGNAADSTLCTGTEPPTSQTCNTQACTGTLVLVSSPSGNPGVGFCNSACPVVYPGLQPAGCPAANAYAGQTCTNFGGLCEAGNNLTYGLFQYYLYECEQ